MGPTLSWQEAHCSSLYWWLGQAGNLSLPQPLACAKGSQWRCRACETISWCSSPGRASAMPRLGTGPWLWEGPWRSPPPSQVGGSANPGWTRPCRKEEEGQGKRRATPDICGARAKLQDTKTRAPPLQAGDGGIYAHRPRSLSFWDVPEGWSRLGPGSSLPISGLGK